MIKIGRVNCPTFGVNVVTPQSAAAASWWLSGGISASDVAGVWAAKGAASLAASYLRLAGDQGNASIDPAIVGGVAPTWDAVNGWVSNGTKYLNTGIIPTSTSTMLIKFAAFATSGATAIMAGEIDAGAFFFLYPNREGTYRGYRWGNATQNVTGVLTAGVMGFAGNIGYLNGISDAVLSGSFGVATSQISLMGYGGTGPCSSAHNISSAVFFKTTITAPQVLAVSTAMP